MLDVTPFYQQFSYIHPLFETGFSVVITFFLFLFSSLLGKRGKKFMYGIFFTFIYILSYIVSFLFLYYLIDSTHGDQLYLLNWFVFGMYSFIPGYLFGLVFSLMLIDLFTPDNI